MVSMVQSHMLELSKDKFGCRVIQKYGTQEERFKSGGWKPLSFKKFSKIWRFCWGTWGENSRVFFGDTLWSCFLVRD